MVFLRNSTFILRQLKEVSFLFWCFVLSLDLELGHESSHFSKLFQNEDVCDFRDYSHDFRSHSGNI